MTNKEKIKEELLNGLFIDGSHHKQYYLEQALKLLVSKKEFEKLRLVEEEGETYEAWEEGMP